MNLLTVADVSVKYGAVQALRGANMHLDTGELVVIVGANGAGKSSLLRGIAGLTRAEGRVELAGTDVSRHPAERRVRAGMCLVPEGRHIFGSMTVLENLQVATWGSRHRLRDELARIYELFPVLEQRHGQAAATLSGGEQQMLAISRALVRHPRLLILDEPSMGLAPLMVKRMFELISEIHQAGTSVLLVEQNARQALSIADRGYVMETSRLSGGDSAAAMLADERLHSAYFGTQP
ncbi:ABC transporter ATP-binding protein [Microbacterium sp. 3J1]|uniref:ABC transporter ATP-binding protein n=1 Tax=Microbacterium sp. 3J1 TaxID=861269 RepID=UPI000AD02434|nr:ABC transporter ATP-binding protein [Microbacterium sp. 3J1]